MSSLLLQSDARWIILSVMEIIIFGYFISPLERRVNRIGQIILTVVFGLLIVLVKRNAFIYYFIYSFFLQAIILALYVYFCCHTNLKNCFYISSVFTILIDAVRLVLQDIVFDLYLLPGLRHMTAEAATLLFIAICAICELAIIFSLRSIIMKNDRSDLTIAQVFLISLPVIPYAVVKNIKISFGLSGSELKTSLALLSILLAITSLATIIGNEFHVSSQVEKRKRLELEKIVQKQQEQFKIRGEVIDIINHKYHDMKHYLTGIKMLGQSQQFSDQVIEYVSALEREIAPYEAEQSTGNEFLNIILTEKLRFCQENNITITTYIDGSCLSFMDGLDICTLFGNALDNAIEAVSGLEEIEKRQIHIKVTKMNDMVVMRFHNYYEGKLNIEGRRLMSTKVDSANHGYGIRSMEIILKKYGGALSYTTDEGEFIMNMILPAELLGK